MGFWVQHLCQLRDATVLGKSWEDMLQVHGVFYTVIVSSHIDS